MKERRIALQQRHDERLAILLITGGQHQPRLDVDESALEHPRFVVEPAAERGQIVAVARARQLKDHERLPGRRLGFLPQEARLLGQELDECLPTFARLPAIDATAKLRIERDRTIEQPQRDIRVLEPARGHQRATDDTLLISNVFRFTTLVRFLQPRANRRVVAERGENGQRARQRVFSREQVEHSRRARLDHVRPGLALDGLARVDQHLGGHWSRVGAFALGVRAVHGVGRGGIEQRLIARVAPRDQRWIFRQQRSQPLVVLVVNRNPCLRRSPVEPTARALLHFGRESRPAGESVFTRDDELRVAVREWEFGARQLRVDAGDGFAVSGGGVASESLGLFAKRVERRTCGQISSSGHSASFHETPVPAEQSG